MPSLTSGLYQPEQNISNPALSNLVLSYRATFTQLATGGTVTLALPANSFNPAQVTPAAAPTNYAPQASPVLTNNEPQQGRRLFVTNMIVRDLNGSLTPTGGTAATNAIQLIDQTQSNAVVIQMAGPTASASAAPYYVSQTGIAPNAQGVTVVAPYDQLALVINGSTVVATAATSLTVDVFGFWQQGV